MDSDIARWVLEFLLRQPLDDRVIRTLIRVLPLSDTDSSLKKNILLRRIESEISNGTVSEKILSLLEHTQELDSRQGIATSDSMKQAYCAVAVHSTTSVDDDGKYFESVKRIWRGRVAKMEEAGVAGLVSEELRRWNDEIEAAVWDVGACENVRLRSKGIDVVGAVKVYIEEAKEGMGPPFLELVSEAVATDDSMRKVLGLGDSGGEGVPNTHDTGRDAVVRDSSKEIRNGNGMPRRKHVANKQHRRAYSGTSRGVKIAEVADSEELRVGPSFKHYGYPATPEIDKVQGALESSCQELQAVVKDPLPDALHMAQTLISKMARENMDHETVVGVENRVDVDAPNSSTDRSADAVLANEGNPGNQSNGHQDNGPKPSLMERNSTARTYEWEDSVDELREESPHCQSRPHLPSPRKRTVSPLTKYEITKLSRRRKIKRWSTLEEDTLRTGVQKFGKGNWKLILNAYRDIFEERTE
ncbi:hypothetical protein RJ640_025221, partial [Escallonia rubra]